MLNFVTITLVSIILTSIANAQQLDPAADPRFKVVESHPFLKSMVTVNQLGQGDAHHGNGFVFGPGGCYVATNFHVAFGVGKEVTIKKFADGNSTTVERTLFAYPNRIDFINNWRTHTLEISADLDTKSGRFKKNLTAKVLYYATSYKRSSLEPQAGSDIAILRLSDCLGDEFTIPASATYTQHDSLTNLSTLHLYKDSRGTARVYEEASKPCRSATAEDTYLPQSGAIISTCSARPGASGSMLIHNTKNGPVLVGLNASTNFIFSTGKTYLASAHMDQVSAILGQALHDEGQLTQIQIADAVERLRSSNGQGAQVTTANSSSTPSTVR